jgi:mono/diheme cytochrome c family protein
MMCKKSRLAILAAAVLTSISATAADATAGKAKVDQACAECHRRSDFSGESPSQLEALLKDIVSGKVKHSKRPLQLTSQEITDIAAYWAGTRK